MLALESSRQQQFPFFSHDQLALDPEIMDSYGFSTMQQNLQSQPQEHHSYPQQNFYEPSSSWTEQTPDMEFQQKQQHQHMLYPAGPNSPPSMAASHYSAASGASIASASSSAMGSPYSGAAHTFQESWIDTANGLLGMPMMMPEIDYPMNNMEGDSTFGAPAKFPTVGMLISSRYQSKIAHMHRSFRNSPPYSYLHALRRPPSDGSLIWFRLSRSDWLSYAQPPRSRSGAYPPDEHFLSLSRCTARQKL
jgi:hypothetical protein